MSNGYQHICIDFGVNYDTNQSYGHKQVGVEKHQNVKDVAC